MQDVMLKFKAKELCPSQRALRFHRQPLRLASQELRRPYTLQETLLRQEGTGQAEIRDDGPPGD